MGHFVQAIVGSKRLLDTLQQRFGVSRVVELSQGLFMLPMLDELYDALPSAEGVSEMTGDFPFQFLDQRIVALLVQASHDEPLAYFATEYFGGAGNQGAIVAKDGKIAFGPVEGSGSINSALRMLGAKKERAHDEFDAVGLSRFRSNEDWLHQPSYGR
jgi:hypothetical protein